MKAFFATIGVAGAAVVDVEKKEGEVRFEGWRVFRRQWRNLNEVRFVLPLLGSPVPPWLVVVGELRFERLQFLIWE